MMPVDQTTVVKVGIENCETAFAGWRKRWKHRRGRREADGNTHTAFMDMPLLRLFEEAGYVEKPNEIIVRLHEENLVSTEPTSSLRCCSASLVTGVSRSTTRTGSSTSVLRFVFYCMFNSITSSCLDPATLN